MLFLFTCVFLNHMIVYKRVIYTLDFPQPKGIVKVMICNAVAGLHGWHVSIQLHTFRRLCWTQDFRQVFGILIIKKLREEILMNLSVAFSAHLKGRTGTGTISYIAYHSWLILVMFGVFPRCFGVLRIQLQEKKQFFF
jgi:hypothetical protein